MKKFTVQEGQGSCFVCGYVYDPYSSGDPEQDTYVYCSCPDPSHNQGYVYEASDTDARLRDGYHFVEPA